MTNLPLACGTVLRTERVRWIGCCGLLALLICDRTATAMTLSKVHCTTPVGPKWGAAEWAFLQSAILQKGCLQVLCWKPHGDDQATHGQGGWYAHEPVICHSRSTRCMYGSVARSDGRQCSARYHGVVMSFYQKADVYRPNPRSSRIGSERGGSRTCGRSRNGISRRTSFYTGTENARSPTRRRTP